MVALQLMGEEDNGRDTKELDRRPPDLGSVKDLTRRPSDLEHSKGIDSQGPSRLRTLPDPSIVAASRPPAAAPKLVQQRVTKTKKDNSRPPISSTTTISGAAPSRRPLNSQSRNPAHPGRKLVQSIVYKKMSTTSGSCKKDPSSQGSYAQPDHIDSHPQSVHDTNAVPIETINVEDHTEEEEEGPEPSTKRRKLTSTVWKEFTRVQYMGATKAKCVYCFKKLSAETRHGTKHLHDHLKSCTLRKIKMGNTTLAQSCLRFGAPDMGKISVENYTFDQDIARQELAAMIVLHEYPLSIVDHAGFRRFVSALQPLFKMGTRNTIRNDIMVHYEAERKKAIDYMASIDSRVAITTDLWTSDNQKRGYMAITTHFIDKSWNLRSIVMRFIYVPAPHTTEVIGDELYESMVDWNLDEKISTLMRKKSMLQPFGLASRTFRRGFRKLNVKLVDKASLSIQQVK